MDVFLIARQTVISLFLLTMLNCTAEAQGLDIILRSETVADTSEDVEVVSAKYHIPDTLENIEAVTLKFYNEVNLHPLWIDFSEGEKAELRFTGHRIRYHWHYKNGKPDGIQYEYDDKGVLAFSRSYKNGVQDGPRMSYHPNGRIQLIGQYENDKAVGIWYYFDETGNLIHQENRDLKRGTEDPDYWQE